MSTLTEVNSETLISQLLALKDEDTLYIPVETTFVQNMELNAMKQLAMENLFNSCISRDQSEVKKDQLQSVIEEYSMVVTEFMRLLHGALYQTVGENAYRHITHPKNRLDFSANYQTSSLVVYRVKQTCNCKH